MDSDKALWTVWNRPVRPASLALSIVTLSLGINAVIWGSTSINGPLETVAGVIAVGAAAALWVGWWSRSLLAMLAGLLLAAWCWGTAAWAVSQTPGINAQTVVSASCWCLCAAGLWLRDRREIPRDRAG